MCLFVGCQNDLLSLRHVNIRCRKQEGILLQPVFQPCEKLRVVMLCPFQLVMISVKRIVPGRQYIIVIIADTLPCPEACHHQIIVAVFFCKEDLRVPGMGNGELLRPQRNDCVLSVSQILVNLYRSPVSCLMQRFREISVFLLQTDLRYDLFLVAVMGQVIISGIDLCHIRFFFVDILLFQITRICFLYRKISQRKVTIFLHGYRCRYIKAGLISQVRHLVHIYANPYICKGLSSTKVIPNLRPHTDTFISISFQFLQQTGLIQIHTLLSIYLSVFIQEIHMKCMELFIQLIRRKDPSVKIFDHLYIFGYFRCSFLYIYIIQSFHINTGSCPLYGRNVVLLVAIPVVICGFYRGWRRIHVLPGDLHPVFPVAVMDHQTVFRTVAPDTNRLVIGIGQHTIFSFRQLPGSIRRDLIRQGFLLI